MPLPGIHPSAKPKNHNKAEHFAKDQDRSSDRGAYADLTDFLAALCRRPSVSADGLLRGQRSARARPAWVCSWIRLRSNSANAPTCEKQAEPAPSSCRELRSGCETDASHLQSSMVSIDCFIERAKRSSFHTISVSPLLAAAAAALGLPAIADQWLTTRAAPWNQSEKPGCTYPFEKSGLVRTRCHPR